MKPPRLKDFETSDRLGKDDYEAQLLQLQHRLRLIQMAYVAQGLRAMVVMEGWDASGKGGLIRRFIAELDPRFYHVWPISAPDEHERKRHFLYRFWRRLPGAGEVAVFDRSWYGRVLVERVEGLASEAEWQRAYGEINAFEASQFADGVRIVKLFVHVTQEVQDERLRERLEQPWKRWKTGFEDYDNRARRADYLTAIDAMFEQTHNETAPWFVIAGNDKRSARVRGLSIIADRLADGIDCSYPPVPDALRNRAERELGVKLNLG